MSVLAAAATAPSFAFVIGDHLPILQVIVPLLGAVLCALTRRGSFAFAIAALVSWSLLGVAIMLLWQVLGAAAPITYYIGGWAPPWGIEYRVDALNAFILVLVAGVGAITIPFAYRTVGKEIDEDKQSWFYALFLLCLSGLMGMAVTGDAFNIFVFMEVSSLSAYALIAMGSDRRALLAAYQYLIMGTIGATFYVIGIGLLYVVTGTLNLADLATRIGPAFGTAPQPILAALAFIVVGISLKLALFPLHLWLPNAYAFAPTFVTTFLAATATKVAVYILLRLYFTVFGGAISLSDLPIAEVLLMLSIAAMFIASILAVYEDSVERMLAYSSVAQIGCITLGMAIATRAGLTGSIVHLLNHAVMKATLFMAIGAVVYRVGTSCMSELAGIGRKMPLTMGLFVVAGLSIIGVPGTAGFISKWQLGIGAVDAGLWPLVFVLVGSSLIAVIYIGKVVEVAYFREPGDNLADARDPPASMLIPMALLGAATIYFGLDTTWSAQIADTAAQILIGGLK